MNKVIGILLIAGACWGVWALRNFYLEKQAADPKGMDYGNNDKDAPPAIIPQQLQGLHYTLETPLENARNAGADGMKKFLDQYRPVIKDPRLAWIELDYVSLLALKDPAQARVVFAEVKKRTPTNSPVYSPPTLAVVGAPLGAIHVSTPKKHEIQPPRKNQSARLCALSRHHDVW